ncbi:hypothetical protein [Roseisolibacter sp. H3M3-2]|uniref:hypothetical protein n=1 Tax=Roseisolibacter sp. H3M3-2 TaxID=3031323 RepID=UPI0023DA9B3A|nr:hypothetical protein [Roseisolibacter sp. H3M3-2]MDF1501691.1 hypothetical protein [Roseisolibacter sp. H3M3-2]
MADPTATAATDDGLLRPFLLLVVLVGAAGLAAELLLLEHWEPGWQWVPLVLLGATVPLSLVCWRRPSSGALRAFRALMWLCVVAGGVGVLLHYLGNAEFERESDPTLGGLALFWTAARGATPALAPGALAQLGVVGLLFAWRHPVLRSPTAPPGATR